MRRPREEVIRSGLPFRLTYILDELLLDHPDVRIAVHSSWRQLLPDREVCGYLGPLSERFICSTVQGDRWPSILQSVALLKPQAWIVLDDHASEFSVPPPQELLVCDSEHGIWDPSVRCKITKWLRTTANDDLECKSL